MGEFVNPYAIGRRGHHFMAWTDPEPEADSPSRPLFIARQAARSAFNAFATERDRLTAVAAMDKAERAARIDEAGRRAAEELLYHYQQKVMPVTERHKRELATLAPKPGPDALLLAAQVAAIPYKAENYARSDYLLAEARKGNAALIGAAMAHPYDSGWAAIPKDMQTLIEKTCRNASAPEVVKRISAEARHASHTLSALKAAGRALADESPTAAWLFRTQIEPIKPGPDPMAPLTDGGTITTVVENAG